jgi:hypothetical protein
MSSVVLTKEKIFKLWIMNPVPTQIQILEGRGLGWEDCSGYVVFNANEKTVGDVINKYKMSEYSISAKSSDDRFRPVLKMISDPTCYYSLSEGHHEFFLCRDKEYKKVYFFGHSG